MWSKLLSLSLLCLALGGGAHAEVRVGDRFPALTGAALTGDLPSLTGKVLLVDFCASWCAPCRDSFPVLTALQHEFGERGLVVIGVSVDQRPADFQSLLRKWKPGFTVLHDAQQRLVAAVKVPTMPTSFLVDADGVVRFVHSGFHPHTAAELRRDLLTLLPP